MTRSYPNNCEPPFSLEFEIERACAVVAAGVAYAMLGELNRIRQERSMIESNGTGRRGRAKTGTLHASALLP
jgi:hypothetical protein